VIGRRAFGNYAVGLDARTIAMIPARIASGRLGQLDTASAKSGDSFPGP
jgi:hypothetical protein